MNRPFLVLSVDGGGFRGLFAAHLLRRMEESWGVNWSERFDLFAGTSTGAILAAGLACGISAKQLAEFYQDYGRAIFSPRLAARLDRLKLFTSRYSVRHLRDLLEKTFGHTTLGEVAVPMILPSVDINNGCVHVLKSGYDRTFVRDAQVRVSDAVLASCSAPTYFDPHVVDAYQLVDGGLWANNPSLVAALDAHYRLSASLQDIRIISIGTGTSKSFYPRSAGTWKGRIASHATGWGIVGRWGGAKLLDLVFNLQSEAAHNMLCLLLGESPLHPNRVLRLTFTSEHPLPMDRTGKQDDWIATADRVFTHNAASIASLLSITGDSE